MGKTLALGIAGGLAASLVVLRSLDSALFGLAASDPLTYLLAALLLGGVAVAAAAIPARHAARVDPLVALRTE